MDVITSKKLEIIEMERNSIKELHAIQMEEAKLKLKEAQLRQEEAQLRVEEAQYRRDAAKLAEMIEKESLKQLQK